jgi:hypothetical protein
MEWLVGQDVTVLNDGIPYIIEKVIRVTKTQVVLSKNQIFRVKDGHRINRREVIHSITIESTTQEHLDILARNQLLRRLKHTRWSDYTTETLQSVCAVLEKDEA